MNIEKQIEIIRNLIDGVKELNGEFQDGWDEVIKEGEELVKYLNNKKKSLPSD